jgi:hypothetical protein
MAYEHVTFLYFSNLKSLNITTTPQLQERHTLSHYLTQCTRLPCQFLFLHFSLAVGRNNTLMHAAFDQLPNSSLINDHDRISQDMPQDRTPLSIIPSWSDEL